ncbi:helix-turn-helix domain-containing protein [Kineosporia babensis]
MYDPFSTEGDEVQTTEITGSTVPRRQLGRYMRDLRGRARMTVRAAAQELEWSEGKIWRIETGQSSMRSHDAELMCRVYGADLEIMGALKALARETRSSGWWHSYGDIIPEFLDLYIGLEEVASSFCWYETHLVPGLLQTEAYARALIENANPGVEADEIERLVSIRTGRGSLLTRPTARPDFRAVVGETALRSPYGGAAVMVQQLEHLSRMSEHDHVQVRVMPFAAELHSGVHSGPFIAMRFPVNASGRESEPPTIYVESFTGALYLDRPAEVERYDEAWQDIWEKALDGTASVDLIETVRRELET